MLLLFIDDYARVKLLQISGKGKDTDYINASYIDVCAYTMYLVPCDVCTVFEQLYEVLQALTICGLIMCTHTLTLIPNTTVAIPKLNLSCDFVEFVWYDHFLKEYITK